MKGILVEHQIGFEILDLGQQDCLGLCVEAGAEADLAGQWPQHRLQRRHGALQPAWKRGASARRGGPGRFDGHPVLARPCRLQPGIVDVDLCRRMAERGKIPRVEIGDAEQAGVSRRHLGRVTGASEPWLAAIQPAQEARVVRIEHEDAHGWLDRAPEAVILVDPRLVGAAGDVTPPCLRGRGTTARSAAVRSRNRRCSGCRVRSRACWRRSHSGDRGRGGPSHR